MRFAERLFFTKIAIAPGKILDYPLPEVRGRYTCVPIELV